ncbi:MAG: UDP-N-acetylmuramoyl-L-alanine--D-glutamate ligase [Chloroflexi bacterium]|nr:UDP-N-acetylmuramoyl-L-alanine--D-glutamate ligase [Chloroflexota bacterium]
MTLIFDPEIDPAELGGRRVTIVGFGKGRTGSGLARWLVDRGAKVTISDRKPAGELAEGIGRLREMGIADQVELALGPSSDDMALADPHLVFVMPGIRPRSATILRARERDIPIATELGLFFRLCPATIVGITGTKGKSTTTTLIGRILQGAAGAEGAAGADGGKRPVLVGGNIGRSVIEELPTLTRDHIVVLELSSFQLETLGRSPHVAVVTNVLEDHLDHHGTRDEYVAAKGNIVRWQRPRDTAVLNLDDATAMAMHEGVPSQLRTFSLALRPRRGAYLDTRGRLVLTDGERETAVCEASELRIPGRHNVANALAAAIVGDLLGVAADRIAGVLRSFEGLRHRLEPVGGSGGVLWVNDSQGTTPYATIPAIAAYARPVVVILGGVSKDADFTALADVVVAKARAAILMGQAADDIATAIGAAKRRARATGPEVVRARDLRDAVERARAVAKPGDVVLLSPAAATAAGRGAGLDEFSSYEERGDRFRDLVRELAGGVTA